MKTSQPSRCTRSPRGSKERLLTFPVSLMVSVQPVMRSIGPPARRGLPVPVEPLADSTKPSMSMLWQALITMMPAGPFAALAWTLGRRSVGDAAPDSIRKSPVALRHSKSGSPPRGPPTLIVMLPAAPVPVPTVRLLEMTAPEVVPQGPFSVMSPPTVIAMLAPLPAPLVFWARMVLPQAISMSPSALMVTAAALPLPEVSLARMSLPCPIRMSPVTLIVMGEALLAVEVSLASIWLPVAPTAGSMIRLPPPGPSWSLMLMVMPPAVASMRPEPPICRVWRRFNTPVCATATLRSHSSLTPS